ncbi:MAG: histidine kinase [Actinomycetota bacterium]|nr:histidine kinase [Actinomycetota bacterium]
MNPRRTIIFDMLLLFTVTVLAVVTGWVLIRVEAPQWVLFASLSGLTLVAMGSVLARLLTRPDHLKALQSHLILEVAVDSLSHLRQGLNAESAQTVCRLALGRTEAAAVAITNRERILGFAGIGEDHHTVGGPILTQATRDALERKEHRILDSKDEIGCSERKCMLRAAIVVPLEMRGIPVGTLKFYYTTRRLLNETQVAMAEGLATLLSTQLELSELEQQTELATRMELKALQAQINPHFLFNTINTIAMLIRTEPESARVLLREFARFYRRTLESGDQLIPLEQEIDYVRSYLAFEKARFGDRVSVREDLHASVADVPVPAFIVQPIVENAIQHGMRPEGVLHIDITAAFVEDGHLELCVVDDGVGISEQDMGCIMEPGYGKGLGIALKNVDDRLKGFFGPQSGLEITSTLGIGTNVCMTIFPDARQDANGGSDAA